jgi:hypothetical protein
VAPGTDSSMGLAYLVGHARVCFGQTCLLGLVGGIFFDRDLQVRDFGSIFGVFHVSLSLPRCYPIVVGLGFFCPEIYSFGRVILSYTIKFQGFQSLKPYIS